MKLLNLIRRSITKSVLVQSQTQSEWNKVKQTLLEVPHIEVETDWMQDCPSPQSATRLKLNGMWPYHEFWRKTKNDIQKQIGGEK